SPQPTPAPVPRTTSTSNSSCNNNTLEVRQGSRGPRGFLVWVSSSQFLKRTALIPWLPLSLDCLYYGRYRLAAEQKGEHAESDSESPLLHSHAVEESGADDNNPADARARHRRQHCHLHRRLRHSAGASSLP